MHTQLQLEDPEEDNIKMELTGIDQECVELIRLRILANGQSF